MPSASARALFDAGHDSGLAGQITARAEADGTYYTQRLGLGFDEITDGNLLLVDEDLNVLEGDGMANPANRFHSWIYRARPDVQCIVHTHAFHVAALSMLEVPLVVSHMDTTPLYDDGAQGGVDHGVDFGLLQVGQLAGAAQRRDRVHAGGHQPLDQCGQPLRVNPVVGEGRNRVGDDAVDLGFGQGLAPQLVSASGWRARARRA